MLLIGRKKLTDKEIVEGLQENTQLEDAALKYLYSTYFPKVKKYILSCGGNDVEAKDIFQNVIIVFYQNVKAKKFELTARISTYLITLARNMWINRKKELLKLVTLDTWSDNGKNDHKLVIDHLLETERSEFAVKLMENLGEDCRTILILSIYQKISMKKISTIMGFQNGQVARNKKSKCLKYLKKQICRSVGLTNLMKELK